MSVPVMPIRPLLSEEPDEQRVCSVKDALETVHELSGVKLSPKDRVPSIEMKIVDPLKKLHAFLKKHGISSEIIVADLPNAQAVLTHWFNRHIQTIEKIQKRYIKSFRIHSKLRPSMAPIKRLLKGTRILATYYQIESEYDRILTGKRFKGKLKIKIPTYYPSCMKLKCAKSIKALVKIMDEVDWVPTVKVAAKKKSKPKLQRSSFPPEFDWLCLPESEESGSSSPSSFHPEMCSSTPTIQSEYLITSNTAPMECDGVVEYVRMVYKLSISMKDLGAIIVSLQLLFMDIRRFVLSTAYPKSISSLQALQMAHKVTRSKCSSDVFNVPSELSELVGRAQLLNQQLLEKSKCLQESFSSLAPIADVRRVLGRLQDRLTKSKLSVEKRQEFESYISDLDTVCLASDSYFHAIQQQFRLTLNQLVKLPLTIPELTHYIAQHLLVERHLPFDIDKQYDKSRTGASLNLVVNELTD